MGCAGSASRPGQEAMEKVEKELDALGEARADVQTLERMSEELKGAFSEVVAAGARDVGSLRRIEVLSEKILTRLKKEIGDHADSAEKKDELLKVAKILDGMRATRASTAIEDAYSERKKASVAKDEEAARGPYQKLKEAFAKINGPTAVVPNLAEVLDAVEQVHLTAPESAKVNESLIKTVTQLTEKVLKSQPQSWGKSAGEARQVLAHSKRLDELATKMVVVLGSSWEPPLHPEVAHRASVAAQRQCAEKLNAVEQLLERKNPGGAYPHMEQVQAWFDLLPEDHSMLDRVVGVFGSVDLGTVQRFKEAIRRDDKSKAAELRALAKQFDALRGQFKGLPAVASRNLDEELNLGEVKARVEKHLDAISAELKKKSPETSALTVGLQAVAADWDQVTGAGGDDGLASRLSGCCGAVEEWSEKTTASSKLASQWNAMLAFAGEFDKRRREFALPDPPGGPLQERIGRQVASNHLKVAEADLKHPKIPDPKRLLDSLRGAIAALPKDSGDICDLSERLAGTLRDTEERALKGYQEALEAGERRRCGAIIGFAEQFDEVGQLSGLVWSLEGATLGARLQDEAKKFNARLLESVRSGDDFPAVLRALQQLEASKPPPDTVAQLPAAVASLGPRIEKASKGYLGGSEDDAKAMDGLCEVAKRMDAVLKGLNAGEKLDSESEAEDEPAASEEAMPRLYRLLLGPKVDAHVARAERLVAESPLQCPRLQEHLAAAKLACQEPGCPEASRRRLLQVVGSLEGALLAALMAGVAATEVLDAASTADEITEALGKAATGGPFPLGEASVGDQERLRPKLESVKVVAPVVQRLQEEASKEAGAEPRFDPRKVIAGLRELEPRWASARAVANFEDIVLEVVTKFGEKIKESATKNAGSAEALKVLAAIGREADEVHAKLAQHSARLLGTAGFEAMVARVTVTQKLTSVEAELAKESSMNPTLLLKGLGDLAPAWGSIGGEATSDPGAGDAADLVRRVEAVRETVHTRMVKSMQDAREAKNAGKVAALTKFAEQFDAALAKLERGDKVGCLGGLKEKVEVVPN